jgi:hypothetical protein
MIREFENLASSMISVEECLEVIAARTINDERTEWENGYNSALRKIAFDLRQKYKIE